MTKIPIGVFFYLEGIMESKLNDDINYSNARLSIARSFMGDMKKHRFHTTNITLRAKDLRTFNKFLKFKPND